MSARPAGSDDRPLRIVCLGGGFVAVSLVRALRSQVRAGTVQVTVVDRDNFLSFHGFVPEMLAGRLQPGHIMVPARRAFRGARFHNAEIEAIDLERRVVTTARGLDGREYELPFDHLVLGLGSRDDLSRFPGLEEHAFRVRHFADAVAARARVVECLELAEIESDPVERRRLLTFVVGGGNYGGIEIATELLDCFALSRADYPGLAPEEFRVVLVHPGDRVLPELAERQEHLRRRAERHLATSGVDFRLGTRLAAATRDEVVLTTGERIASRTILSSTGTDMSPLVVALPVEKDERGRVRTDEHGRVLGAQDVWAAGDCAAFPHPAGGTCPPLAVYARAQGRHVGRCITGSLSGAALPRFRFTGLGDVVALGRHQAVGHVRGVPVTGVTAWVLWRLVLLCFVPTADRKARVVFDWLMASLVGPEVVAPKASAGSEVRAEYYEPGQEIVRMGESGRRLYFIRSGQVEVVRAGRSSRPAGATGDDADSLVLGAGDHFGEQSALLGVRRTATIRARTPVALLSLNRSDARAMIETLPALGALGDLPAAGSSDRSRT